MNYTHKKRQYNAHAVQWTQNNLVDVQAMLPSAEISKVGDVAFIRYAPGECNVMKSLDWIVKGENGDIKIYSDDIFHIKYEEI